VADHDWEPHTGTADVPPGAASMRIAFQIQGPGAVWMDDLRVLRTGLSRPRKPKRDEEAARRRALRELLFGPEEERPEEEKKAERSIMRTIPIIIY
jgi:hypothetical protein